MLNLSAAIGVEERGSTTAEYHLAVCCPRAISRWGNLVLPGLSYVRDEPLFRQHFMQLGADIAIREPWSYLRPTALDTRNGFVEQARISVP